MELTHSLEDYLETIYLLCTESKIARVRDIAAARGVTAASVGTALKRLSQMGLIVYERREYITLTDEGKVAALKIYSRHQILFQFFHKILGMEKEAAQEEACGLEHALSDEGMERIVRFFEQLSSNEEGECIRIGEGIRPQNTGVQSNIFDLPVGKKAVIKRVLKTQNNIRPRLLDMGIIPNLEIVKERAALGGDPIWVKVNGTHLALRKSEAQAIIVYEKFE
ncbi:MAG: DtxR family transcriptional regulator [Bradymonadia bacterium]|jgi:DtxR family Mn-dependent transcriptional regulator